MTVTQSSQRLSTTDINRFVETGKSEDTTLDFKLEPYKAGDDGSKDFVKDVTAFANSQGGHIVIGIEEQEGIAIAVKPITNFDWDREILRLENLCQDRIEPKIIGIDIYVIEIDEGAVLAVKVPKSWTAPHRAQSRKSKNFYQRHSRSISEMDVAQLRDAFIGSASTFERAAKLSRAWKEEFLSEFEKNQRRKNQRDFEDARNSNREVKFWGRDDATDRDGIMTLHIIPVGSMVQRQTLPVELLEGREGSFCPIGAIGVNKRINLQGVRYFLNSEECTTYTQLHRFGGVEAVADQLLWQRDGGRALLGKRINQELKDKLPKYLRGMRELGVSPPIFIKLRISRVTNSTLDTGSVHSYFSHGEPDFTSYEIDLPDIVLTEFPDPDEINAIGKKLLDPLWNAYGRARCTFFDDSGAWLNSM